MKKSILFLIIAISCAMQSFAYDFPIIAPSGQVIYLNIVDSENHTACVTYPCLMSGDNYYYGYDKPTGDLIIPETFTTSSNVTWTIVSIVGTADVLKEAGLKYFIHVKSNVLETLQDFQRQLGITK